MTTETEIRAEQASQVLNNPVFKQAFYPLQVSVIDEISTADIADKDRLAYLAIKLKVIGEFEQQLIDAINDLRIEERPVEFEHPNLQ